MNTTLLFVFEFFEGRDIVRVIFVDFLSLSVMFWRQRCQVGITLVLEQSVHVGLRRHCEYQYLHPVRQCPDVYGFGVDPEDVLELGLFP